MTADSDSSESARGYAIDVAFLLVGGAAKRVGELRDQGADPPAAEVIRVLTTTMRLLRYARSGRGPSVPWSVRIALEELSGTDGAYAQAAQHLACKGQGLASPTTDPWPAAPRSRGSDDAPK